MSKAHPNEKIIRINIEDEMKSAYIDYSMSVIVSRALPDVRDGLKPVHRRVLFSMSELGVTYNKAHKKSARIVGECLGKYHPHGDSSVYDTMVRMAQDWSLRYTLVDGQGNFGSIDGDNPAAMRYTEARLKRISEEMLGDLDKNTVDFKPNFDDSLEEPTVLPTRIPNLLVNGASGIAVGMATNMPPHNLSEVVDGTVAYIQNPEITIEELMTHVKAPDFPTGGTIYGYEGVKNAFETGRGRIVIRAKYNIEQMDAGRERIVITEIPFQLNKSDLLQKIAELINEKKIEGISELRDESDRDGMRVVFELKRDAITSVVMNSLYKFSSLQSSFSVNNIALVKGKPELLNLKDMIHHFVDHRMEVVIRRSKYELEQDEKRAHILQGLLIALDHLDPIINLIRKSKTPEDAKNGLIQTYNLSEVQAKAILNITLQRLTGLERDKITTEYDELQKKISYLNEILVNNDLRKDIITKELLEVKERYGDARRSEIVYAADEFRMEDIIPNEDVVVTISHLGYIKRTQLSEYRTQNRGGKGSIGSTTRDEDFLEHLFVASAHDYMLLFTEQGKCFWMRVYEIPEGTKASKGRAIQNLIHLDAGNKEESAGELKNPDKVKAYVNVKSLSDAEYLKNNYIILCTNKGTVKKTSLEAYSRPRTNGINAITIREGEQLLEARLTNGKSDILMASYSGRANRFNESNVRPTGRTAAGVTGMRLENDTDEVVGMICIDPEAENRPDILVLSENGYGKRTSLDEYRVANRGGKGPRTLKVTDKVGKLVGIKEVTDEDDIMIITQNGVTIRLHVSDLKTLGRLTQGGKLITLKRKDSIAAIAKTPREEDEEEIDEINTESIV